MNAKNKALLDPTGILLLQLLQQDARLSFSEMGKRVGLSTSAVIERVRRMEESGLILAYRADVDAARLGYSLTVFLRLHTTPDRYPRILALVDTLPEVLECYHVTGEEAFILKAVVSSVTHLEDLIRKLSPFGKTSTSVVLSAPVRRQVQPLPADENDDR